MNEKTFGLKRQTLRFLLALLVLTLVLATPFNALANTDNAIDSGVSSSLNYKYLKNSIAGFFQIFGITTPLHAVNLSNDSGLNNITHNSTIIKNATIIQNTTITTASQHVPNAAGKVVDKWGNPLACDISIRSYNGNVKKQNNKATQYNSSVANSDVITFDAKKSKNVTAKFKLYNGSGNGIVVLDNFGKVKPVNVKKPKFTALKYVEIHAENVSYDTVEITVTYTDEELSGFDENKLVLYHYTNGNWVPLVTTVDPISKTLTAHVDSLSVFAIGQGSGINLYSQIDGRVNSNVTVMISGAVYYDNLTAVDGASINISIQNPAISRSVTSDSDGNFKTSFLAPSSSGNYDVMINATLDSMAINSTRSLEVTNSPLFKVNGEITVTNQDVVAPGSNITFEYGIPTGAVSDNSIITITGKTNVSGNKTYNIYTNKKVDYQDNATGIYTFVVDSLTTEEVNITSGNIITNAISYTGKTSVTENYDNYLDSLKIGSSHAVKPWDHSTWFWSNVIPFANIKYNQSQRVDTVKPISSNLTWFNFTSDVNIGFEADGLSKPANASFYVDNIKLISASGDLNSTSANMTGYMNDTTDFTITSDSKGGIEYTTLTSFHGYFNATSVTTGANQTVTLSFANDDVNDWNNVTLYYDAPKGAYNFLVIDPENDNFNYTSSCIFPPDGGDAIIPSSVVGTVHDGSTRTLTLKYSLKQLNVTTVTDKETYTPGQSIQIKTDVLYDDLPTDGAVVWVQVRDPEDVLVIDESAPLDVLNYSLTKTTDQTWKVGIYHVTVNATQTIDGVDRTGIYNTSFAEGKLIMYVQGNGPYYQYRNITIDGRAYYSDNSVPLGEFVNITVGSINTSAEVSTTGYFNVTIPGVEAGTYAINATIADVEGLTDNDNDSIIVLDEPFFILVDSNINEMSNQVLMTTDHTFNVTIPSGMDVLSSTITLTGITEKIEDTEVTIADDYIEVIDADIGTEFLNFVNGTFVIGTSPYTGVSINSAKMTLVAAPDPASSSILELYFGSYVDDLSVNGSIKFRIDEVLGTGNQEITIVDDITDYVSPGVIHEVKISKLGSTAVDCNIYVIVDVNKTGYLDTPLNPRASIAGNIIYAESGDMLLSSHTVDVTKFMHDGANSMYFANDRNALINYVINVKGREWNYTQETVVKSADKFEIENILYAEAPEQQYNNPEIIHPLKKFASNLTVFDMDNNIEITSENYTISNDELLIHTEAIGPINAGNVRIFNVSYDAPRPNILPSIDKTQYNPGDDVSISASINFTGSPVTDANVSAVISSATVPDIWEGTLTNMGDGVYTGTYSIPANTILGDYTVSVKAFNDTLNLDNESVVYKVRRLNVSVNAGGPYVVDTNASITGFVRDLENNTGINGAPVNIRIWNSTFSYNTTLTTDATGYYSLSRLVDYAGDYNVTVNSSDTNILGENNFYGEFVLWHFDEGSGNKTADMSGINPGTINLGTLGNTNLSNAWVNGKIGTALNFDGVDDCIDVDSPNPGIFHDAFTERTFVGWIKTDNSSKTQTIYEEGGSTNGLALKIGSGQITLYTQDGNDIDSVSASIDTGWHFITSSFNNSELQLWVDNTKYSTTAAYSIVDAHGNDPGIGKTFGSDGSDVAVTGDYFDGTMDEVRIYDRALSDLEIADRYNNRSTNYRVKYNVSVVALQSSYTENSLIPINVTIYDSSMIPVSDANVNYTFQIGATNYYHNGTTDIDGKFDFIFSDTGTIGRYNVSTNVSKLRVIGNSTQSFRVSSLSITEFTDKTVYIADDNVDVWGRVYDNEAGVNASGASYNVSVWRGAQYITSSTGSTNGTGEYSVTFSGLSAGSYTANVDVTYDNIIGSKTTPFEIRYDVTTTIPKSLYGIGEQVDMNIGVFDTGSVPVTVAVLIVTITNSSGTVTTLTGPNITDNSNGYYTTNFTPGWSDDFNIAAHVANGSVIGDAASVPFRATGFYVDANSDLSIYEAGDTVYINGSLWDSLGSSRQAHVTIKVFDSQNTEVVNVTKSNQFDNYSHNFNLPSTALAGTYTVWTNASEIESGGSLTAGNSTTFDVEYIVTTSTNRSEYNTNDSVKVTVNVKNGTNTVDGTTVAVSVTNSTSGSVWSGSAGSIGSGNYTATFTLTDASLGNYTVDVNVSSPWVGDATSIFTVRELDITSYLYGPYNFNETHNGPLLPLFVAGTVLDSEHGNVINGAFADISIYYPNDTLAANQIVNTNDEGVYLYNFTSNFSQSPPAGLYNVTVNLSDSGITNSVADNFTIYTVDQSWQDPSWEYRIPILLYNESSKMNTSGLVGSWNFTGEKVLTITDSSGNGNLGTLYGYSVENPGFETNSKWDGGVGVLEFNSTQSKNGARSGKIVSVSTAPIDPETTLFNDVTSGTALPNSNVQYKYGGWVYNEGGSGDIFVFSWDSGAPSRYDSTYNAITTSVQNQWTYISGTTTNIVPADDFYDLRLDSNGAAGLTTWFDDVWVNPVEPWTTGITGQALQMDGTDDYMQISNTASMNTESFTISMWFKSDQTRIQGLAHKIAGNGWRLFMTGTGGNVEFDAAGEVANIQTSATVAGEWYHVAATYDANEKTAKIYLNGKLSQQATDVLMQNNYSNPLDISSLEGSRFDGIIDNVEFYDHALSAVEIDKRYTKITTDNTVFDLTLPGGSTGSTALLYDIDGNQQSATITDFGSYVNINIPPSIGIYENKIDYLYFDRPSASTPYVPSMTFISGPYHAENGNVDGYKIEITKDAPLYPQSSVAKLTANLSLIDTLPLTGAVVNFTIYYPNGTLVYGPYNNVSDSTNISQLDGSVVLSYSIPAVKGMYSMTVNATSPNGIHRTESSTFNVGGLKVLLTTDKDLYNTGENVLFTVDVSDGIAISGANVSIDVSDESNDLPYEFEASLTTDANGLAEALWHIPTDVQLGNYSIIVNANTANDSGYNGSQSFMVDRYELGLTTNTEIIGFNESLVISGNTTHNYINVDSYANVSVLYQNGFIDDVIPYGATVVGSWNWDYEVKHSGMRSHYQEASDSGTAADQHLFYDAYSGYRVGTGEIISAWVYIDPLSEPVDEIMLKFHTTDSWEHRAYWGSDLILDGTNNTNSRRPKGALPTVGQWTQLNVTTTDVGLDGLVVDGIAFSLNEVSSNTAKVWFDDVHFSGEATHDSYLENQNMTSTGGAYVVNIENDYTETFNDTFTTFNSSAWTNTTDSYLNDSQGYMVLEGTGSNFNSNFNGKSFYDRSSHPVMKADFKVNDLNSILHVCAENTASTPRYRRFGMQVTSGNIVGHMYDPVEGWVSTKVLFTPVVDTWYTAEIHFYDTHSSLYVYSRDDDSRPKPDNPDYEYNLSDWNPRFHFWAYRNYSYIDNVRVDLQSTSDTLPWVGEYIVTSNSSYANLSRTDVTGVMVADMNITVDAAGPYSISVGDVSITGTVKDNRSAVARTSDIWIYVTAPNDSITLYTTTSDANGNYAYTFSTPTLTGTYDVKVTARDAVGVVGSNYSSFDVGLYTTMSSTTGTLINVGTVQELTLNILDSSVSGNPVVGADVTINITKPDSSQDSYATPGDIIDNNDGTYTLNYVNTNITGNYTATATSTNNSYAGMSSTTFMVDEIYVSSQVGGPYIVGDKLTVTGSAGSIRRPIVYDGNASINLTYPNGTSVEYVDTSIISSTESLTQSGIENGSGFFNIQNVNDGSTGTYAYTGSCSGASIQVTWPENKTISRVKASYFNIYWPTSYKIQVLDSDGITWIDKKVVTGYATTGYPTIEDRIPMATTKGVRIYYQTSNSNDNIYIYEMYAYGPDEYSVEEISLPISGNYTLNVSAIDSTGIHNWVRPLNVPVQFLVSTEFDKISYDSGDNVTAYVRAYNGTGNEPGVDVTSQLTYVSNGSFIDSDATTADSTGIATLNFTLPLVDTSYSVNSSVLKDGTAGYESNITSTTNLRMWADPAEALVGNSSWPENVTPTDRRDLTIYTELLDRSGHAISDRTVNASIYRYDGVLLESITLTNDNGLYSGNYNVSGNAPEGKYWFELDDYPGVKQYFNVVEWGCARCHIDIIPNPTSRHGGFYLHDNSGIVLAGSDGYSDGYIYPSNFSKEFVHKMHPIADSSPWGNGYYCGYHNNAKDWNCVKCHPTEVLPSACPDCHNSANNKWENILTEDYGADVHAGINWDVAQGKTATSVNGGYSSRATDTDEKTMWEPDGVLDQVLEVDLGGFYIVDGVRIAMANYRATYTIKGWNGSQWTSLKSLSNPTYNNYGNDNTYTFTEQNISKVRFTVSAWARNWNGVYGYCNGENAVVVAEQPQVKSINVYTPNNLPGTAANGTSHIICQTCHGGDIPNDVQPTIPECTDCHPQSTGSGMQVMPSTSTGMRQLEDYEDVSDISVAEYRSTVNSFAASGVQVAEGSNSGKLDYSISNKRGKITLTYSDVDLTNITSIKFWLYGNPSDDDTRYKISILNSKSGIWHYSTAQNFNWTGWKLVTIPITSFSQVDILYINYANTLRMQLETSVDTANSGVIYIDDLYVERQGTHTLYQEVRCGLCHKSGHDREPAPLCQTCHQTQSHGNTTASEPTICLECHYMENSTLIVRNIANGNNSTLVEIPMDGATISKCDICHDPNEPHNKQWVRTCIDCHRESGHGAVDASYSDYEKASTCLKCHDSTHNLSTELASGDDGCNGCHQFKIHGPSTLGDVYNESLHLDCMRCHGNPLNDSEPLPMGLGHPGEIHLNTTIGLESTQCLICHGNATFSYELHTGESVDISNTTLVDSIDNESICVNCHDPVPDFKDTNVSVRDELPDEPHAPVVNGHGNVSCFVCHGHYPASLTYGNGFDCVDCHIDPSKNDIELINNSIPKNNKTSVYNNSSTILLVTAPQVLGHGNADCSACHGHSDSKLTYTGSSEADCLDCHENSSKTTLLLKYEEPKSSETEVVNNSSIQWLVIPPQIFGHGNVTCTECHTHSPSDFGNTNDFLGSNCMECHGDTSRNVTLINNTIPKNSKTVVVDNSSSRLIVSAPPVLGHGNASCSVCHGHTNPKLTFVGGADGDCVHCHEDDTVVIELLLDSDPKSETTLIVNGTTNPKLVTPPQVSGHGNVSCSICHDHSPSDSSNNATFSMIGGNCSACHKNASHEVNLINGTIPTNSKTTWINYPNATPAIVVAPQVFGHGRQNEVACTNCHGHTNSRLSTPSACKDCHDNISKFNELNSTYGYEPPQVAGHGNMSCDNCHSHDSPDFTFLGETDAQCLDCHVNSSTDNLNNTWNLLNNTKPSSSYTIIVNGTTNPKLVNPPQTAKHGNASCVYCHSHAPPVYDVNSMVTNGTDCISCHVNNLAPIVPLQNNTIPDSSLTNWTNEGNQTPALVFPPQIVPHGNATLNGDTNRDGELNSTDCYECHGHDKQNLIEISSCMTCHGDKWPDHPTTGSNNNTNEFCMSCHNTIHKISRGGSNCMASTCHGGAYKSVNATLFENSVHVNINSGSNSSSVLIYEFEKACWLCHGNGSEPDQNVHLSDLTTVRTCYDPTFCHGNSSLNQNVSVEEHFVNGTDIQAITNASDNISSCIKCHNLTEMKVTGAPTDDSGLKSVSHYARNYTTISSLRDNINSTDYCLACHGNTNSIFYNASIITKTTTHGNNCSACHGAGNIHDSELASFSGGAGIADCLDCHKDNSKPVNATVFNDSVHVNLNSGVNNTTSLTYNFTKACWLCHGNGTQPTTHLSNLTTVRTCYDTTFCHGNTTLNKNVSVREHFVNGIDIATSNGADDVSSCIDCHNLTDMKVTGAPTDKSGLNLVSHYAKNYTTISSLRNNVNSTTYCLACHNNTNSIFYNAGILTKTTNHGENCSVCHSAGRIHDETLTRPQTSANCTDCHALYGANNSSTDYHINITAMNLGVHANLNSNMSSVAAASPVNDTNNSKCWGCHVIGGAYPENGHADTINNGAYLCYDCHNGTAKAYANVSSAPAVYNHIKVGVNISARTVAATTSESCGYGCHNLTSMKVPGFEGSSKEYSSNLNLSQPSHYTKNRSDIRINNNLSDCMWCHKNSSNEFIDIFERNGTNNTADIQHAENLDSCILPVCHNSGRIHDQNLTKPTWVWNNECKNCHFGLVDSIYYMNETMFNASVHKTVNCTDCHTNEAASHPIAEYNWKWCECCHSYQNDPINQTDRHNVTRTPSTYSYNGTNVLEITDCTTCHDATAYNEAVEYSNTSENKCRYCHAYPDKGNMASQDWF